MKISRLSPDRYQLLPDLPKPEQSIVLVAEHEGRIVGHVGAERSWVVSPFAVDREFRGSGLAEQLGRELITYNLEGLTEFLITTNPHVDRLVFSLGFRPLLGQLWVRRKE